MQYAQASQSAHSKLRDKGEDTFMQISVLIAVDYAFFFFK